jgi:hypothetical protein
MRKQLADEAYKQRELDIREREAAIKEQELGIKSNDTQIRAQLEQTKIADAQAARNEARQQEMAVARQQMRQVDGEPGPVELLSQQQQDLQRIQQVVADLHQRIAQPKRGRMVKRADGVWDFHVEAPGNGMPPGNGMGA